MPQPIESMKYDLRMKISKSKLKSKLFNYLRKVTKTGQELVITERGKPVLKILPIHNIEKDPLMSLVGMVEKFEAPLEPVGALWNMTRKR